MGLVVPFRGNARHCTIHCRPEDVPTFVGGGFGDGVSDGIGELEPYLLADVLGERRGVWQNWRQVGKVALVALVPWLVIAAAVYVLIKW